MFRIEDVAALTTQLEKYEAGMRNLAARVHARDRTIPEINSWTESKRMNKRIINLVDRELQPRQLQGVARVQRRVRFRRKSNL